jgi:cytochrome c-type biogenesis protein CcmH/NrfG
MKIDLILLCGMGVLLAIAVAALLVPLSRTQLIAKKGSAIVLLILLVISASGLYAYWGAYKPWTDRLAFEKITDTLENLHERKHLDRTQILVAFEACEKEIAYSTPALARLANIYTELGLLEQARDLWDQIIGKAPDNQEYWLPWLYSHTMVNEGKLPPNVRAKAERWAAQDPPHRSVLNMLAMDDYFQGNYDRAIQAWTVLLAMDKDLPEARQKVLQNAIAMAVSKKQSK